MYLPERYLLQNQILKGGNAREVEANRQKHLEHNPKLESHIQKQRDGI